MTILVTVLSYIWRNSNTGELCNVGLRSFRPRKNVRKIEVASYYSGSAAWPYDVVMPSQKERTSYPDKNHLFLFVGVLALQDHAFYRKLLPVANP